MGSISLQAVTLRRVAMVFASVGLSVMVATPAFAQTYDLVISGSWVMDPETMYDDIANVGAFGMRDRF